MVIDLDPDLKSRIDRLVAERGYENAGQLLADALNLLEDDPLGEAEIEAIKALIDEADADDTWLTLEEVEANLAATAREIETKLKS